MAMIVPFPSDFPHKGEYRTWDRSWNPLGYRETPQYAGQQPIRYPLDASLFEMQLGGYRR